MDLPLVVGVDGSEPSLGALEWAVDEAARHRAALRVLYANLWERYETTPTAADVPGSPAAGPDDILALAEERARKRDPGVDVVAEVIRQDPEYALLDAGRNALGLVVASRGRGAFAELLLGSTCLGVAARAQCPVFVVRGERAAREGRHGRVLLGVDEASAGGAVRFAFREAEVRSASVEALRAWRSPAREVSEAACAPYERRALTTLDDALRHVVREHPGVVVSRRAAEGPARRALLARAADADLLVLGTRRRRGLHAGLQLGRVAHAALHHAACPVVVVPECP